MCSTYRGVTIAVLVTAFPLASGSMMVMHLATTRTIVRENLLFYSSSLLYKGYYWAAGEGSPLKKGSSHNRTCGHFMYNILGISESGHHVAKRSCL